MSEEYKIVGGGPNVLYEDAVAFMRQRTDLPCPSCGHAKWDVSAAFDGNNKMSWCLPAVNLTTFLTVNSGIPVVLVECRKCAFLRLHAFTSISKWVAAGRPEFVDDE